MNLTSDRHACLAEEDQLSTRPIAILATVLQLTIREHIDAMVGDIA
jgi:hypothetical protein